MQKLIAKYGLAAHLALLAVAPLFLFPFVGRATVSAVVLWLSLQALIWLVLAPSVLQGERLRHARQRVLTATFHDPLFWVLVVIDCVAAVRAINSGITLAYDAEVSSWAISSAKFPIFPGSVGDEGVFPFVAALAASILLMGCRHALGRSARLSFLLLASSLAGLAAVVMHVAVYVGFPGVRPFVEFAAGSFNFIGFVFGLYLLTGIVSLFVVLENGWNAVILLPILSIGGNAAACFSFAPVYLVLAVLVLAVILRAYMVFCTRRVLQLLGKIKIFLVGLAAVILSALLVMVFLPENTLAARLAPFREMVVFPDSFWNVRRVVSAMAFKSWISHLWTGTGLGSFVFDFRFNATAEDWQLLPRGAVNVPNGWWQLLAERGIVGFVSFLLPIGFLTVSYVRRLVDSFSDWSMPHPASLLAPILLVLLGAAGFVDYSLFRPEVQMICWPVLAISALAFPKKKKVEKNG